MSESIFNAVSGTFEPAATTAEQAERYVLENRYIQTCDALRVLLGMPATRTKLGFAELEPMMQQLRAADADSYEQLRDGMQMLNAALTRFDVKWWDGCVWHKEVAQ